MIEILKQALEALKDVGVLTDREWQAVHKNKVHELRQAIAEAEKQSHPMMNMPHDRMVATAYGYPPQRKPLTDEECLQIVWETSTVCEAIRKTEAAHGIKEQA